MAKPNNINLREIELKDIHYKFPEDEPDNLHAYIHHNKSTPSTLRICGPFLYYEVLELLQEHFKSTKEELIQEWDFDDEYYKSSSFKVLTKNGDYIFLRVKKSFVVDDTEYVISAKKKKYKDPEYGWLLTSEVEVLYNFQNGKPKELINKLKIIMVDTNDEHNKIGLICQSSDGSLYTKDFPMMKEDSDFDLDLHYGVGFSKFHEITSKRIDDSEKGIILFHGVPGSGKTHYIKRLVSDLMKRNKKILYLPNNIVDLLGTPAFNNFLLDYLEESIEEGNKKGILIIIEDAEKVLLKRETNPYGSSGVSNILNATDGILNDFLSIQVLCTFNTEIENIDEAILRKKRAISIREFKKLTIEDSQKLINHLGLKYTAIEEMTLSDIYSIQSEVEDEVLLGKKKTAKTIGFSFKK